MTAGIDGIKLGLGAVLEPISRTAPSHKMGAEVTQLEMGLTGGAFVVLEGDETGSLLEGPGAPSVWRALVQEGWAQWLGSFEWSHFFTMTVDRAKAYNALTGYNLIGQKAMGRYVRGAVIKAGNAFVALETHKSGDYHAHGLLNMEASELEVTKELMKKVGFAKCEPLHEGGAVEYCAKYLHKDPEDTNWLFLGQPIKKQGVETWDL